MRLLRAAGGQPTARGALHVYSCPRAVCSHVETVVAEVFGQRADLEWREQSLLGGSWRTDVAWTGPSGSAGTVVSRLRTWPNVRVEALEEPGCGPGERYLLTPSLGIHRSQIGHTGETLVAEDQLSLALARCANDPQELRDEVERLLGLPWEAELEPFRWEGDGGPVRWVHRTG